jgi:tripartite-type tricarboxylate transporter receptor subunit TctC
MFLREVAGGLVAAMLAVGVAAAPATAQTYPTKAVRLVVGFTPAGTTDILARLIGAKLSEMWKEQVIVDNRPGSGGNVGAELVAKAPPDGHTLLVTQVATHGIAKSLYPKLSFDPIADFAPVTQLVQIPNMLTVHPSVPAKTVAELIALAKAQPGKLNFASSGNGTSIHLSGELFKVMTGVDMVHVPYKGSGPALNDLVAGQVQLMFDNMPSVIGHVQGGRLRALGVTSASRNPAAPDVPSIGETVKNYEATSWFGIAAPARTPDDVVNKIQSSIAVVLKMPDISQKLAELGAEPVASTPAEFGRHIRSEIEKWAAVVKASGATVD